MAISDTVDFALTLTEVDFRVLRHRHTETSREAARRADVSEDRLAKAMALRDEVAPLLAVIPASRVLNVEGLRARLHRPSLRFMTEQELAETFVDCETRAVPPLGPDYRTPTVLDSRLTLEPDVYFEAGDQVDLVHVSATSFRKLMRGTETLDCSIAAPQGKQDRLNDTEKLLQRRAQAVVVFRRREGLSSDFMRTIAALSATRA